MNPKPKKREKVLPKEEERIRLREERTARGLTQKQISESFLGVAELTYRNWETGKVRIPDSRIEDVAAVFGVRPEYLRGEDNFRTKEDYDRFLVSDYYKQQTDTAIKAIRTWRGKTIDDIASSCAALVEYIQKERELPAKYKIGDKWYYVDLEKANSLYEHVSAYLAFLITQEGEAAGNNGND